MRSETGGKEKNEIDEALKAKIEEKKASGSTGCAWNAKTRYESFLEEERTKNNREEEKETSSRKIQSKRTFERPKKPPREGFDELPENTDAILQVNEGKYEFTLGSEGEDIDADVNLSQFNWKRINFGFSKVFLVYLSKVYLLKVMMMVLMQMCPN